eukprot:CAMPEP_0113714372 /NCGR_PEP_ID=MMETSP0038_2-20120614/32574_1 /TAXON_ID=2898 /ORGANISM="Cryptomonas paramecium" /LENGTH=270 /DNA_ID=CAMNT_0000641329 /DNA_START=90 /DNA_END=899 /DNA_ORIENTATION=- /assembly_acc=CAM_ASM_000170
MAQRKVRSQKVDIDIDFKQCIVRGTTHIEIEQESTSRWICLNADQLVVKGVTVGGRTARWEHKAPMNKIGEDNVRDLMNFRVKYADALRQSEYGELKIPIPDGAKVLKTSPIAVDGEAASESCSYEVSIDYTLSKPRGGLIFAGSSAPGDSPLHCYTDGQCTGARLWFPCLDSLSHSSAFELRVSVPKGYVVVASMPSAAGEELQEQPDGKLRWIFCTRSEQGNYDIPALCVGFAAGPFLRISDPGLPERLTHYCLPFPQAEQDLCFSTR